MDSFVDGNGKKLTLRLVIHVAKQPLCRRAIRTGSTCGTKIKRPRPLWGDYVFFLLKKLFVARAEQIRTFQTHPKTWVRIQNFHNVFLLSKIIYLKICLFLSFSQLFFKVQKLHQAKFYMLVLQTATRLYPYPISDFSNISVFVKALSMVKQRLDGIWLDSQEYTNSIFATGTPR